MCGLDDEELRVNLRFSSRVSVRVIFQSCPLSAMSFNTSQISIRTQLPVLFLHIRDLCRRGQLQVCVVVPWGYHCSVLGLLFETELFDVQRFGSGHMGIASSRRVIAGTFL